MKVSGFTYVRNGITYGYPFIESIKSLLPLVDEYIIVTGNSTDKTREEIVNIGNDKIKIVDTIWDDTLREGGKIFAQQTNIGLDNVSKDSEWLFHLQADEVIHEKDIPVIKNAMLQYSNAPEVEGLLFNFINFFGDYTYYAPSRRFHQNEIRIIRNNPHFRSYRDSQGFRAFNNPKDMWNEKGRKLFVKKINASIYHYSYVKDPGVQLKKQLVFGNRWQQTDDWINDFLKQNENGYDYGKIDFLYLFKGTHPAVMQSRINEQQWKFIYEPQKNNMSVKEKLLKILQDITGKQFFINKNYTILK